MSKDSPLRRICRSPAPDDHLVFYADGLFWTAPAGDVSDDLPVMGRLGDLREKYAKADAPPGKHLRFRGVTRILRKRGGWTKPERVKVYEWRD